MKTLALIVALVAASAGVQQTQQQKPADPPKAIDISGKWIMTLNLEMGQATPALVLKQDGEKITGTYTGRYGTFELKGTLKVRALQFGFQMNADGQSVAMSFAGEVAADGESIVKGTATLEGLGDATWTAKRDKS